MILGLSGFKGSGKDTVADWLCQNRGFIKRSFADALKDVCAVMFGWPREMLEGTTTESRQWREEIDTWWDSRLPNWSPVTPRRVLQFMGTQVMREKINQNIWVVCLEKWIEKQPTENKIVVPDCRFPNELRLVDVSWLVHRHPLPDDFEQRCEINNRINFYTSKGYLSVAEKLIDDYTNTWGHSSEWRWMGWRFDQNIDNTGTLDHLYDSLSKIPL